MKTPTLSLSGCGVFRRREELANSSIHAKVINSAWRGYRYHTTRLNDVNGIGQAGLTSIASSPASRNTILHKTTTGCVRHINHTLNPGSEYALQPGPRRPETAGKSSKEVWECLVPVIRGKGAEL